MITKKHVKCVKIPLGKDPDEIIDCHKCEHYYVSWDKDFPHGCKAMGFKSKRFPSIVVRDNSHSKCLFYKVKK